VCLYQEVERLREQVKPFDPNEPSHGPGHEALHLWFNLTYAAYLVLPRTFLQSMPDSWQGRLAQLLNEMNEFADQKKFCWPDPDLEISVVLTPERDDTEEDVDLRKRVKDDLANYERGRRRLW
jgi:hypothetical protein